MSDDTVTYSIRLDENISGTAEEAAARLDSMRDSVQKSRGEVRELGRVLREFRKAGLGSSEQVKELAKQFSAQRAQVAASIAAYVRAGGSLSELSKRTNVQAQSTSALTQDMNELAAVSMGSLAPALASPVTAILALTAAATAMISAVTGATSALLSFAIASADSRLREISTNAGLNTLPRLFGRIRASAEDMTNAIDRSADATVVSRDRLNTLARQLAVTGLQGSSLATALEAVAVAQQVQGDRGAAIARRQMVMAARGGRSVEEVAARIQQRLGPIARRQLLEIGNQIESLKTAFDAMFRGVEIEGFLTSLSEITNMLAASTAEGRSLRLLMETIFQPLIDQASSAIEPIRRFIQGLILGFLETAIAIVETRNALERAFGRKFTLFDDFGLSIWTAVNLGRLAFSMLMGAITVTGLLVAFVVAGVYAASRAMAPVIAFVFDLYSAITNLVSAIQNIDWSGVGASIMRGLVAGVVGETRFVQGAITRVATSIRDAFASVLQIRSPSKVFEEFGGQLTAGLALGVEGTAVEADRAVSGLISTPEVSVESAEASSNAGPVEITINVNGADGPEGTARAIRDELAGIFEGLNREFAV